nr:ATP synthase F0 subunit 8 [Neotermes cubanus]
MPQMMPMSWLIMFIMFSTTLILFATANYYTKSFSTKTTKKEEMSTKILNWKW